MQSILSKMDAAQTAQGHGNWSSAADHWQDLYRENPLNKDFIIFAGNAYFRAKDYEQAISCYQQGYGYSRFRPATVSYNIACCYALSANVEEALHWLTIAIQEDGFSNILLAQEDNDLEALHDHPDFRSLVGLDIPDNVDTIEGWRMDLALMAKQIKHISYRPFHEVSEAEFDAAVQQLHDDIPHMQTAQIILAMMRLLAIVGNGHTNLDTSVLPIPLFEVSLPLELFWLDEGLVILSAHPNYESLLTCRITHIDGHPIEEIETAIRPLISRDNEIWYKQMIPIHMMYPQLLQALGFAKQSDCLRLTLIDTDGNTRHKQVEAFPTKRYSMYFWQNQERVYATIPAPDYMAQRQQNYWLRYDADDNLLYVQFNQVRNMPDEDSLSEFAARVQALVKVHTIETIVVDVRWNTGGNNYLCMPLLNFLIGYDALDMGNVFVIIGRRTFSAAQNFVSLLERHSDVIFVGEPTGSAPNFIGETTSMRLPYSGIEFSVADLFWQNSVPTDMRPYIAPHIYTPLTLDDVAKGEDPAMRAIREGLTTLTNEA